MPKAYEALKEKFMKEKGMTEDKAQEHAAKIYNYWRTKGRKGFQKKLSNKPESEA